MTASSDTHTNGSRESNNGTASYSMLEETKKAVETLLKLAKCQIPHECQQAIRDVKFTTANTGTPDFPCPFKETEAAGALKAVEAGIASSIADLALGPEKRKATVDLERASAFLFSTYLATIGGLDKGKPESKKLLKSMCHLVVCRYQGLTCAHRHRSSLCSVRPLPTSFSQPLRNQESRRILPSPRLPRSNHSIEHDWITRTQGRSDRLSRYHKFD
jgi:hypothetical protein